MGQQPSHAYQVTEPPPLTPPCALQLIEEKTQQIIALRARISVLEAEKGESPTLVPLRTLPILEQTSSLELRQEWLAYRNKERLGK
jgi:hypothetical protein